MAKKQITNYKFSPGVIPPAYNQYPNTVALLVANKAFLVAEIDAYIRQQITANASNSGSPFYNYVYDTTKSAKCQRDIGYLLDAVIYDVTYGGNSLTYQISQNYFIGGVLQLLVPALEINVQTWLRGKITNNILTNIGYTPINTSVTQNTSLPNAEAGGITKTTTLMNVSINAITSGLNSLPAVVAPDSQNSNLLPNAVGLIAENERFIQEEVIAFIAYNVANNIAPFAFFTYDAAKCRRDVSYILEGYLSDLRHGGNRQTCFNAGKYFTNGIPQIDGSRSPEVAAHTFIKNLIINYILTNTLYTARNTTVSQVIDQGFTPEVPAVTNFSALAFVIINVITNGLSSLPPTISNRGSVKFPGFYKLKDILLITNTTRNIILYNFADPMAAAEVTYSEVVDSDFAGATYGFEQVTTVTFDVSTTGMMVTDNIQIFVEGKEQIVRMNSIGTDAMERMKVGIPQSMLDADFEYGLQPTKWQTISMMRNYPSVYEIPGSDQLVSSVVTDASTGTSSVGASLITVTTVAAHGFNVGDVFTIKALASSISGFSRAEGTFLVASVTNSITFSYYAKSKVGVSNGQVLSSSYTQLRKAGFYTGASVGTPAFNVFSNGQSGTITTLLVTASGSTFLGYSGSAPPVGAPISGTGIITGTQITAVVGPGGTAAATTLTSSASIGDTQLVVTSTAGILPGLVFDRGDSTAVQVTNITNNTVSLSGALTSAIVGTNQTYAGLSQSTTSGTGAGAVFDVSRIGAVYSAQIGTSAGTGYVSADTLTILGTSVGGTTTTNDVTITVLTASVRNAVDTLDNTTLFGGTRYTTATNVITSGGTGLGLTVDIIASNGTVTDIAVNTAGADYTVGDTIIIDGLDNNATIQVLTVQAGGLIESFSVSGTPITAPSKQFVSALTLSDVTTTQVSSGNTGISYSSIGTIEVTFGSAHGFIPGDTITTQISSTGSNAQFAAGAFFVEQVPTATSLRYTARAPGIIANTLTGVVYSRPDSYYVHRPLDGGVQLGTGGASHGATAIRMSKKYIRYQSGKGVMYNTGALFAPSYNIQAITANGTAVGSTITLTTDDTDHGCQVGAQIQIVGVTTSGYNGVYTVSKVTTERVLSVIATQTLGSTTGILSANSQMSVRGWHGATVRSGTFDDQNGMFWQYDGIRMALVKRSSTFQIAGTITIAANSNSVSGTNTRFTQQLAAGDRIVMRGMSHVVSSIIDDSNLTVTPDYRGVNNLVNGKACKTVDLIVPQDQWNLDPLNGSGPSGYSIDVTKMQMIGMQWTWYGAGFIDFMLRGPQGDYVFAHRFRNSNVNTEAYMRTGNQPVRYEVINEGAKDTLSSAINSSVTTIPLTNAYWFPTSGTVMIENEMISFTGNTGTALTGCTRGTSLTQFVAGSNRSFSAGVAAAHPSGAGVILVSNTITPIISHWGSAFMIDGQFDNDRGYIFNYAATGVTANLDSNTSFLMRLAPSVSNAQVGDLGDKELLNRAQLLLQSISVTSDAVSGGGAIVVQGILNPINYPSDPTKITWTSLQSAAAGGQPSFAQIASGGSVTWSGNASTSTATVQGAFTTTIVGRSFAPVTNTLTAISFGSVTQTAAAASFGYLAQAIVAQSTTAAPYGAYTNATSTVRASKDILITNAAYDALTLVPQVGNAVTGTNIAANTTIVSITRAYLGGNLTQIVLNNFPTVTSTAGTAVSGINISTAYSPTYNSAISTARNDFLIADTAYDALTASTPLSVGDKVSVATYITGGQTVNSFTRSYIVIAGTSYTRIVMSAIANATSTAAATNGANNITVTFTSSIAATYNSAISTARSDFLVTQAEYAAGTAKITDVLSASTYLTGSQTVSSITASYTKIAGVTYARVIMSGAGNATSTAGASNNVTTTATSAATATYGSTFNTNRADFLVTDADWTASGLATGDGLSLATYLTAGQTIVSVTPGYITLGAVSHTRVLMSSNANGTSTSGSGNNQTITATAAGSSASYIKTNYLFFDSTSWLASGATVGTKIATSYTGFPAGTAVTTLSTRTFGATTVYRATFTQSGTGTIAAGATPTFQFGSQYALPGEQVFSFVSNPGNTDTLDLSSLKELTSTSIGGRGTFPNGPDVLAINVYKVAGTATTANVIIRWGEAQA